MENNKKSFLAMDVGNTLDKNGNVVPYAFFVETVQAIMPTCWVCATPCFS